jgi:hypothetical protein
VSLVEQGVRKQVQGNTQLSGGNGASRAIEMAREGARVAGTGQADDHVLSPPRSRTDHALLTRSLDVRGGQILHAFSSFFGLGEGEECLRCDRGMTMILVYF